MWHDYLLRYGEIEARGICNRYLDMQICTTDPEELQFCRELYAAIPKNITLEKTSIINDLNYKKKTIQKASKIQKKEYNEL